MTTNLEDQSGDFRGRVYALVLSGFQIDAHARDAYRAQYLDTMTDADLLLLARALNDLWSVRGIRTAYLKDAVAAGRIPHAVHTLNILFAPFREQESPINIVASMRGLSEYGILSPDGYEIIDHARVGEALSLMRVAQELKYVDDHDLWTGRTRSGGIYISDQRLRELVQSKQFPVYRIAAIIGGHGTGNVDIIRPVLENAVPAASISVL